MAVVSKPQNIISGFKASGFLFSKHLLERSIVDSDWVFNMDGDGVRAEPEDKEGNGGIRE